MSDAIFISGVETRDFKEWSATSGTPVINTDSIVPTGDACVEMDAATDYLSFDHGVNLPDWACSFKFRIADAPFTTRDLLSGRNSGGTERFFLKIINLRKLVLTVPGTPSGTFILGANIWYTIDITHNYVDGSDDEIKVYINDASTPDIDWTGAGYNDIQNFRVYGATEVFYFDDFRWDDVAVKIGDHNVIRADPNGDGSDLWDSGANGYLNLDDWASGTDDDSTTEDELAGNPADAARDALDDYATLGLASGDTINAIKMCTVMKRDGGGGTDHFMSIYDGAAVRDSVDLNPGTSYIYYEELEDGSMPFPSDFDSWLFGANKGSGNQSYICTVNALMVDYTSGVTDFPLDCAPGSYSITGDIDTAGFLGAMLLAATSSYALTGIAAILAKGFAFDVDPATYSIAGVDTTQLADRLVNVEPDSYVVTGIDGSLVSGRVLSADPDSYAITGVNAELLIGRMLSGDVGAYSITGINGTLLGDRLLSMDPGVYSITGVDASLNFGYVIVTDTGVYAITGANAALLIGRALNAGVGGYTTTGVNAELLYGAMASVDPGGYSISGQSATLNFGFVLVTDVGAYAISGINASLLIGRALNAETTTYSVTGVNGSLVSGRVIQLDVGSYIITGVDANLLGPSLFLNAAPGIYALSGIAATVLADQLLSANPGNYLVTGVASTLLKGFELFIDPGTYVVTGVNGILLATRILTADSGIYVTGGVLQDLFDPEKGGFETDTGSWVALGNNTIEVSTDKAHSGTKSLKVTYVNESSGASLLFNDAADLTQNLVVGKKYQVIMYGAMGSGSCNVRLYDGVSWTTPASIVTTTMSRKQFDFIALNATTCQINFSALGPGEIVYTDDISLREVFEPALVAGRILDAGPTTYSITGVSGSLVIGRVLSADPDSYLLTGQDASLLIGRALSADNGSYALAGQNASILIGRALSADPSSYSMVGQSASLVAGYLLVTDVGAYLVTGSDASLIVDRMLNGGPGVYSVTGIDAILQGPIAADFTLDLEPGVYALTGDLGTLLADRLVNAAPGAYVVLGEFAVLERVYIGALVVYYRSNPLTTVMSGNAPFDLVYRDKPKKVPA